NNTACGLSRGGPRPWRHHRAYGETARPTRRARRSLPCGLDVRASATASCAALRASVARAAPAEMRFFPPRPGTPVRVLTVATLALFRVAAVGKGKTRRVFAQEAPLLERTRRLAALTGGDHRDRVPSRVAGLAGHCRVTMRSCIP